MGVLGLNLFRSSEHQPGQVQHKTKAGHNLMLGLSLQTNTQVHGHSQRIRKNKG
jgi:hypothetical protein